MATELNDLEGLRISMDIENRGYNFYRTAYEKFSDPKIKQIFKMLMEEEAEHLKTFTHYFEEIEQTKEAHSTDYLFDPEVSGYLTVLAESSVFPPVGEINDLLGKIKTPLEVLILAMRAEKDSILFYSELIEQAKFPQAKKVFQKLKLEEQHHTLELGKKIQEIMHHAD